MNGGGSTRSEGLARSVAGPPVQTPATPAEPGEREPRPAASHRPLLRPLGLFLLLLALCAPLVALHESKSKPLFVLDEFAYADYLQKVHDGQLFVRRGEVTGQRTLRELACRGYNPDAIWPVRPPCDAPSYDPAEFPNSGVDSADVHPPTYFVITDLGARAIMALGITDNLVRAGRLFGAVWMAAGLLALWYLMRAFGANRWAAALGLGLVTASPALRWAWYYLTPDAANILVGSLVVLAVLRWERADNGLVALAGAGALAMGFKAPNLVVVVAVATYLAVRAALARRASPADVAAGGYLAPRRYLLAAASVLGGASVVVVAWLVARMALAARAETSPAAQDFGLSDLGVGQVTENLGRFISTWDESTALSYPLALIASYVLVGSILAAVVAFSHHDPRHALASVAGAMLVVGPLLIVVSAVVTTGTYFVVEARYGASLVPLECAVAACLWRGRAALVAVGALVVSYNAAVLVLLLRQ